MAGDPYVKHVFQLPDLLELAAAPDFIVAEAEFQGCDFHGPAVFLLLGGEFQGNKLNGNPDGLFWEIAPRRSSVIGAFGFRDCAFLGCTFTNIGIAGTAKLLAQFDT